MIAIRPTLKRDAFAGGLNGGDVAVPPKTLVMGSDGSGSSFMTGKGLSECGGGASATIGIGGGTGRGANTTGSSAKVATCSGMVTEGASTGAASAGRGFSFSRGIPPASGNTGGGGGTGKGAD